MAIVQTRSSAATLATLRSRVRKMAGDRSSTSANQRWVDADIDEAINDQLAEMYTSVGIDPGSYLLSTTLSYTPTSDTDSSPGVTLPAATQANPIYKVDDITSSNFPQELIRCDSLDFEMYGANPNGELIRRVWARIDTKIIVRPRPASTLTLRIWYIGNPFTMAGAGTTDQHPYPVAHEELIVLGAAIRLQEEDDETPAQRPPRYLQLMEKFEIAALYYRGPRGVRSRRRYR